MNLRFFEDDEVIEGFELGFVVIRGYWGYIEFLFWVINCRGMMRFFRLIGIY